MRNILTVIVLGGSTLTACLVFVFWLPRHVAIVFSVVMILRFLFGAFQAGTFPAFSRMMADWMPMTERGGAQGAIWMSSRIGGFLAPLVMGGLFTIMGGWRMPLVLVAVLGLVWCAGFWPWFRNNPDEMPKVNREERKLIEAGRSAAPPVGHGAIPWGRMVRMPTVWALWLMYGFLGFSGNFYLTMLPTYLHHHRHFSLTVTWSLSALPFGFGAIACLVGGSISDAIIRRWGTRWGRRMVGATGLFTAGLAILAVPWVDHVWVVGFLLILAFFGNDFSMAPAWAAAADIGEPLYRHTRRWDEYDGQFVRCDRGDRDRLAFRPTRPGLALRTPRARLRTRHAFLAGRRCRANAGRYELERLTIGLSTCRGRAKPRVLNRSDKRSSEFGLVIPRS